jgi:lysine-N-methylase
VDQGTYEKYRSHEELKQHVGTLIVLNTSSSSTSDYARMPLSQAGGCGFLEADRMCGIQRKYGEQMLSATCTTYPRALSTTAGRSDEALHLSCPEAARITLLDVSLLGSGAWQTIGAERYVAVWKDAGRPMHRDDVRLAVREFAVLLVTDRTYPIWQRLYLLGLLTTRLEAMSGATPVMDWCDANPAKVASLLAEMARTASAGRLRGMMDAIRVNPAEQLQTLAELLRIRLQAGSVSPRFLECLIDFEEGLGTSSAKSEAEILAAYRAGYQETLQPYLEANQHILENYLTNYIFKNCYPFGRQSGKPAMQGASGAIAVPVVSAEDEHLSMCAQVALIQSLLVGIAARHRADFCEAHVVKLFESFARTIEHSTQAVDAISDLVKSRGLKNLPGIALLLRHEG